MYCLFFYLTGIFTAISVTGADEDIGNRLEIRPVAVVVSPHGQLHFPQNGAFSTTCASENNVYHVRMARVGIGVP